MDIGLFAEVGASGAVSSINITKAMIKAEKDSDVGIVAAVNNGTIFNAFAAGKLNAASGDTGLNSLFGGLVGSNSGTVWRSGSAAGVVVKGKDNARFADAGGLVGASNGTILESYSTGSAKVSAPNGANSGGLIGFNNGSVDNCYGLGAASIAKSGEAGGLIGTNGLNVSNAYSTGIVSGKSGAYVGGSIGYDESSSDGGSVSSDYWDVNTSHIKKLSQGAGNKPNDPGITGLTTAQLQAGLPTGFDPTIWAENPSINNGLPYLINNPPQ
jgi:hypothetical protein